MYDFFLESIKRYIPLTPDEEALLISKVQMRKVRKKQWLVTPGEYCKSDHFVNKGCFRSYYQDDNGVQHTIRFATEGWWMTDVFSLFTQKPATLYVEALEDGEVVVVTESAMEELYKAIPQFNTYFRVVYQKGLAFSNNRILHTISNTAASHYQVFLQQFPTAEQRIPQYMIASYLGVTPEFLSKIKSKMLKKDTSASNNTPDTGDNCN
jgi:CRP-like cAMP-binding protein